MTIDVYSSTGSKKGTATLPKALFEGAVNEGLMHQAVTRQQGNARITIAHAKGRSEVEGSTRKLYQQKGTGRARRGSIRSPLLRGGGKAFGPRKNENYATRMPQKMRRAALVSALTVQAKNGIILGLEDYPTEIKAKNAHAMLSKMPVELGRKILIVTPVKHEGITLSVRNIPNVKTVMAAYLNPVDVLGSRHIIFMVEALKKAEEVFGAKTQKTERTQTTQKKNSSESSESFESPKKKKPTSAKSPKK